MAILSILRRALSGSNGCLVLVALAVLASGCAKDSVEKPTPLQPVPSSLPVDRLWIHVFIAEEERDRRAVRPLVTTEALYWADTNGGLHAFDAHSGERRWSRATSNQFISDVGGGDALVMVATRDAHVVAFRAEDGAEMWRTRVSSEVLAAPQVAQGIAVVQTIDGKVIALDSNDGHELWRDDHTVPLLTLRGTSAPVIVDDTVVVGLADGKLMALNIWDGKLRWRTELAAPRGRSELERMVDVDATPVVVEDTVYAVTFQGRVAAVSLRTGRILWAEDVSSSRGLAVDDLRVYVSDEEGVVWAYARRNGNVVWRQDALKFRRVTGPGLQGGYLVLGDLEGYVHWIDPATGHIRNRMRVDEASISMVPVTVASNAYYATEGGVLDALTLREPE